MAGTPPDSDGDGWPDAVEYLACGSGYVNNPNLHPVNAESISIEFWSEYFLDAWLGVSGGDESAEAEAWAASATNYTSYAEGFITNLQEQSGDLNVGVSPGGASLEGNSITDEMLTEDNYVIILTFFQQGNIHWGYDIVYPDPTPTPTPTPTATPTPTPTPAPTATPTPTPTPTPTATPTPTPTPVPDHWAFGDTPSGQHLTLGGDQIDNQTVYLPYDSAKHSWADYGFSGSTVGPDYDDLYYTDFTHPPYQDTSWNKWAQLSAYTAGAPGTYQVSVTWQDNDTPPGTPPGAPSPDAGSNDGTIQRAATVVLYVIDHLEIKVEGTWQVLSATIPTDVIRRSYFWCRAVTNPAGISLPQGVQWSGLGSGGSSEILVYFSANGEATLTATAGNSVSAPFRIFDMASLQYKKSTEEANWYKEDGGGSGNTVLAGSDFDYRALFQSIDGGTSNEDFTAAANPLAFRWEVCHLDWENEPWLDSGGGKNFTKALADNASELGHARARFYSDYTGNGICDSGWEGQEPNWEKGIENVELRIITRTAKCADDANVISSANTHIPSGINGANTLLQTRGHIDDYRAFVSLLLDGSLDTYTVGAQRPLDCSSAAERDLLFANVDSNIIYVRTCYNPQYQMYVWWGQSPPESKIILDEHAVPWTYAHEVGHNMGLGDIHEPASQWERSLLMYSDGEHRAADTQYCRESDAAAFQAFQLE